VEHYTCDFDVNPLHHAIHPIEGRIPAPQGPGHGMALDADVIEKLRVA
jgi:L-alanine-DL-glutamate epimerase-like enolase superfamily enzyme